MFFFAHAPRIVIEHAIILNAWLLCAGRLRISRWDRLPLERSSALGSSSSWVVTYVTRTTSGGESWGQPRVSAGKTYREPSRIMAGRVPRLSSSMDAALIGAKA